MTMEPTMQLRWIWRRNVDLDGLFPNCGQMVLQQLWTDGIRDIQGVKKHVYPAKEEWRDIPEVRET